MLHKHRSWYTHAFHLQKCSMLKSQLLLPKQNKKYPSIFLPSMDKMNNCFLTSKSNTPLQLPWEPNSMKCGKAYNLNKQLGRYFALGSQLEVRAVSCTWKSARCFCTWFLASHFSSTRSQSHAVLHGLQFCPHLQKQ